MVILITGATVGILREHGGQTFESIHSRAPQALFAACLEAGVKKVVQISALGADDGSTGYFVSKHAADRYLASLSIQWTIVQPSLVFGAGGTSATLFTLLASLPVIPLPGGGRQQVQPIHVDDTVAALREIIETSAVRGLGRRVLFDGRQTGLKEPSRRCYILCTWPSETMPAPRC